MFLGSSHKGEPIHAEWDIDESRRMNEMDSHSVCEWKMRCGHRIQVYTICNSRFFADSMSKAFER